MTALVNGERRSLPAGVTLDAVVRELSDRPTGVAAAINGEVVPRAEWPSTTLRDGDEIEILTAVQGG